MLNILYYNKKNIFKSRENPVLSSDKQRTLLKIDSLKIETVTIYENILIIAFILHLFPIYDIIRASFVL